MNAVQKQGVMSLKSLLASPVVKAKFAEVLKDKAPAFLSSIVSATAANKQLASCEPESILAAAMVPATLDLPINPQLGMAHMVPYKNNKDGKYYAQFQMGWKGFVQLGMRSGQYRTMNASIIYDGDIKSINRFTGEIEFNQNNEKREVVAGYLFYFKLMNGYEKTFYMTKQECEAHGKRYSASYRKGEGKWQDDFDVMALKTVVKLCLSKWGVLSVEMQKALEADQAVIDETGGVDYADNVDEKVQLDPNKKVDQTSRQKYETVKAQVEAAGKKVEMDKEINGFMQVVAKGEKEFDDGDLEAITVAIAKLLEAKK